MDLLYSFDGGCILFDLVNLKDELEKKLKRHVDLISFNTDAILKEFIKSDIKVFLMEEKIKNSTLFRLKHIRKSIYSMIEKSE
ncbi:MAG: hypothetical protein OXE77_02030 [Flavobacteriaceae bacterium]|nr:hypothetical protein [Flavobacteriaceae bacterium]MCY4267158.1 hypothetical protein [Flavobacteriaceae bacterium]